MRLEWLCPEFDTAALRVWGGGEVIGALVVRESGPVVAVLNK